MKVLTVLDCRSESAAPGCGGFRSAILNIADRCIVITLGESAVPVSITDSIASGDAILKNYFTGTFSNTFSRKSQYFFTVSMFTFSSGECGYFIVGPMEIMSQWV